MPTLIRLLIILIVLAGLVFGGMVALTLMVDPGEKDITIKIPARDLVPQPSNSSDPLNINALPTPVGIVPKDTSSSAAASSGADITTLSVEPGAPE